MALDVEAAAEVARWPCSMLCAAFSDLTRGLESIGGISIGLHSFGCWFVPLRCSPGRALLPGFDRYSALDLLLHLEKAAMIVGRAPVRQAGEAMEAMTEKAGALAQILPQRGSAGSAPSSWKAVASLRNCRRHSRDGTHRAVGRAARAQYIAINCEILDSHTSNTK